MYLKLHVLRMISSLKPVKLKQHIQAQDMLYQEIYQSL